MLDFVTRCKTCKHPLVAQINDHFAKGWGTWAVAKWLDQVGMPVTQPALLNHRKKHLTTEAVAADLRLRQAHLGLAFPVVVHRDARVALVAPGRGDDFRQYPPMVPEFGGGVPYVWTNRNKRSVALEHTAPGAGEALEALDIRVGRITRADEAVDPLALAFGVDVGGDDRGVAVF